MKELEIGSNQTERMEIHAQQQKEKKTILIGEIRPQKGHTLFQINQITGEIKEAEYRMINVEYSKAAVGDFSHLKELIIDEDCVYTPALNKANAIKKFSKCQDQSSYYKKEPVFSINDLNLNQ